MSATVTDVTEVLGESGDVNENGFVTFRRRFRVKLSAPSNVAQDMALTASYGGTTIPTYGAVWPRTVTGRPMPTVRTISARPLDSASRLLWMVTVNYSNEGGSGASGDQDIAPWLRPLVYSYDFVDQQVALQQDYSSTPKLVVNTVDEPFDPVPTVVRSFRKITITRASQSYSEETAGSLTNTLNSAAKSIRGVSYPAKMLRLVRWGAVSDVWVDASGTKQPYYNQTIEIEVGDSQHGHTLRVLNQGYMNKVGANVVRATDDDGNPTVEPVLLAADGTRLAPDGEPHFIEFQAYRSANWSSIGTL